MLLTTGDNHFSVYVVDLSKIHVSALMLQNCGPEDEQIDPEDHTGYCSKVVSLMSGYATLFHTLSSSHSHLSDAT